MLDADLIRSINSGRCFALVGAGPSVEFGYPSWGTLAERVRDYVLSVVPTADRPSYDHFLRNKEFPALLRQAEVDLGNRKALISAAKILLRRSGPPPPARPIYDYLAKWPFACYLTTNFDDEMCRALERQGQHFQVRQNSAPDLSLLRDGVSHLVVKIHSDMDHPDEAVLTSLDFDRILTAPNGEHIRQKLRQVFEMFDVFIIGHSMSDPDLQLILGTAKYTASALHPTHMLLADATGGQIREFKEKYNIRLSTYDNTDGTHRNLQRLISSSDTWICERGLIPASLPMSVSEEEIDAASSLFLFQRLRAMGETVTESTTIDSLLLFVLASYTNPLSREGLFQRPAVTCFAGSPDGVRAVDDGLARLITEGMVRKEGDVLAVTAHGKAKADEVMAQRKLEEDQAFGQFVLAIKRLLTEVTDADCISARIALRNALVNAFRSRGIAMANVIMADQSLSPEELSDLFREVSKHAATLSGDSLRAAFMQAAHAFLIEPTGPQRAYLASVSQGFFLYHMAGMDPTCVKIRKGLFSNTCWFIDSNVLIPLIAVGCHNHEYAADLFKKLKAANATLLMTTALLREVYIHLDWAMKHPPGTPDFQAAVMVQEGFKQNLFLDGYVRQSAEGLTGTFDDYLASIIPSGKTDEALSSVCQNYGITVLHIANVDGFRRDHWGDIEEVKAQLTEHRKSRNTFTGEPQVKTEAEVLILIRNLRRGVYRLAADIMASCCFYFLSQSRALDAIGQDGRIVTWTPEAIYRYVSSLPGHELHPDILQECMLHVYFYAGVSFIDKPRYMKYFGSSIRQAKISYLGQVEEYLKQTEQTHRRNDYDLAFDSTPDLEKPFFVMQMGWEFARAAERKAIEAAKREAKADERARVAVAEAKTARQDAEATKKDKIRILHEANRLRNLRDPKLLRKRERQAKKRRRKKKR